MLGIRTNLKSYNPTAPDAILQALADISAYLFNNKDTDPLIKAALVHYQFEIVHPFERYNGIVGRMMIPMILYDITSGAFPLICLSEYLYQNKNEYFDLLHTTQYSGGYIRWIKFFVNAIGETAKQSAELLMQYESIISEDEYYLKENGKLPKSILAVYNYLKSFPITTITVTERKLELSFNTVSKTFNLLKKHGIIEDYNNSVRNRVFRYVKLEKLISSKYD